MKDRVALVLCSVVAAFHLAVANRYDLFRDELYFIVCGRHAQFGYADQPPLVPLVAAGAYAIGPHTWLVRLPAVFAATALVWLVVRFSRTLGGRDSGAWIAGVAAAGAPILMGLTATLNTTTFEPLAWTAIAYALVRALLLDDRRALLWAGIVGGVAMEAKYALPLWLFALALGCALLPERRLFRFRELWLGLAIAFAIAAPSVGWQAMHGFPFEELVRNAGVKDLAVSPVAFVLNQIVVLNPLFAPVWICGLIAPFAIANLRVVRFVPVAFAITAITLVVSHGKDYYLAPAYPALFAIGAVALALTVRNAIALTAYFVVAATFSLVAAPLALPILDPAVLISYQRTLHLSPSHQERGDVGDSVPPLFADMLGWHDFTREVAIAYDRIPLRERGRTSILVDNYGEAAALDIYGRAYRLPPALSGHNQYYFWNQRGQHPANLLRIQAEPERLKPYCAEMTVMQTTQSQYARRFENGKAIAFCHNLSESLDALWPSLRLLI